MTHTEKVLSLLKGEKYSIRILCGFLGSILLGWLGAMKGFGFPHLFNNVPRPAKGLFHTVVARHTASKLIG